MHALERGEQGTPGFNRISDSTGLEAKQQPQRTVIQGRCRLRSQSPRRSGLLAPVCHIQAHSGGKPEDSNKDGNRSSFVLRPTMEPNIFTVQIVFRSTGQRGGNVQESAPISRI